MSWSKRRRNLTAKTRARIRRRDKDQCRWCGGPAHQVDHRQALAFGGNGDDENLGLLCDRCHEAKSAEEAREGRRRAKRRKAESHPGLRQC